MGKAGKLAMYVCTLTVGAAMMKQHLQAPDMPLAQAHANAALPYTPQRERRERDVHRYASRQVQDGAIPSSPHVVIPPTSHVRNTPRRPQAQDRAAPRGEFNMQPAAPNGRRLSKQLKDANVYGAPNLNATAPSPIAYRFAVPAAYGKHSPLLKLSDVDGSESILHPESPGNNADSPGTPVNPQALTAGAATGMMVYDRNQIDKARSLDEDEHGRKGSFWRAFCCRA
jgi:hypothetical protein